MASKPFNDARLDELRLLALLEREASVRVQESENTRYRRMVIHLIQEGYVNGPANVASKRSWDKIQEAAERDVWYAIARIISGEPEFISISHKGSVRRAELEQALMTGRSMEPFGILLDGRYWERDLTISLQSASATQPVAVAFLDMNGLKQINDGDGGHEAGDDAIKTFLNTVRTAVEDVGEAYRAGGDEVVVIMPELDLTAAKERMQPLLKLLGQEKAKDGTTLSASVGIAVSIKPDQAAKDVRQRADQVQYKAKYASKGMTPRSSWLCAEDGEPERVGN